MLEIFFIKVSITNSGSASCQIDKIEESLLADLELNQPISPAIQASPETNPEDLTETSSANFEALKASIRLLTEMSDNAPERTAKISKATCLTVHLPHQKNVNLAQHIYLSGFVNPPPLCSTLGRCGQCKILFSSLPADPTPQDIKYFSSTQLAQGWRLACQHSAKIGDTFALPLSITPTPTALAKALPKSDNNKTVKNLKKASLALDLGTTSLHWQVVSKDDEVLWQASSLNPQMGAGSDVVSRLAVSMMETGKNQLHNLIITKIKEIVAEASEYAQVEQIVLASNPSMLALALNLNTKTLASAPYSLPHHGDSWESLPELPALWIPPQIVPFVGGDISAGYAAILATKPEFPFVLADLGTNGEIILAISETSAVVTSVALGPALEGIGLSCGKIAEKGAITNFTITPKGLQTHFYESSEAATKLKGISATGYLSLIKCLLFSKSINQDGLFTTKNSPLLCKFFEQYQNSFHSYLEQTGSPFVSQKETYLALPHNLYITGRDIEEILKVKGAFSLGLKMLLRDNNIEAHQLKNIYIAGALGTHISPEILGTLGFLPSGLERKVIMAGNTALQGAKILANSELERTKLGEWAKHVRHLDLANHEEFLKNFPQSMRFAW